MSSFTLEAAAPLHGKRLEYTGLTIEEITGRSLVAIAVPLGGVSRFREAVQSAYGATLPAVGRFATSTNGNTRLLAMSQDQFFAMTDDTGGDPATRVRNALGPAGYIVDQSDAWAMVRLTGENCRPALERTCVLDLDAATFGPGCVARTVMEHLATIILCEAEDRYLLMSPRSSAGSFLHALDTSARNVC